MIKVLQYLILILACLVTPLKAEKIKEIKIEGNKRVSENTIILYGKIDKEKDYSENDLNKIIENLYSTDFFEDIKVSLNNGILNLNLKEYPIINQLIISGEKKQSLAKQIKDLIKLKEKRSFIKSYLSKDIDLIKQLYSSLGYNFAEVEPRIKKVDENNLDLIINIKRGNKTEISSIKFLGNQKVRSRRLLDIIASEESKFWKFISKNTVLSENLIQLDKRLLTNYYKSLGFYNVKVTSSVATIEDTEGAELIYSIDEGNRFIINKISTKVDKVFDKNLFFPLEKSYNRLIGQYYSPFEVKKLLDEIDQITEDNNLQFVEHFVEEEVLNDTIKIKLNIFEGEKVLVERINISGNNITDEDVIREELILDEGDPFSNIILEKSISEIKQRNLFREVKHSVLDGSKSNLKIINIEVQEKPTGEISAGAGIGSSGGTFAVMVSENNWLGQGKKVGFELEIDEESLSGTFTYKDPNYNSLGNSINYYLSSTDNDKPDQGYENSIISAGVGTGFEQYKDTFINIGLNASHDDLTTTSGASESLKNRQGHIASLH